MTSSRHKARTKVRTRRPKGRARVYLTAVAALLVAVGMGAYGFNQGIFSLDALVGPAPVTSKEAAPIVSDALVDTSLSGWVTGEDGVRRYYDPDTHELYGGWLDEGDARLYIDQETGRPHIGWLDLDGKRYWLDDGQRSTEGALLTDQWLRLEEGEYYLQSDGSAVTGWADIDGLRCYFDDTGARTTGWIDDGSGKTYWIRPEDGTLACHEWVEIDGVYQAFDYDGAWVTLGDVRPANDDANVSNMSARQWRVIQACDTTPWPGKALCAAWVSNVFVNAGEPSVGGDACDIARAWCYSSDLDDLKPGMVIAVTSHPQTENGRIWGHVCIYIGNGLIRDSGSYGIRKSSLGSWLAWFGASETPRWGWANGINLELG